MSALEFDEEDPVALLSQLEKSFRDQSLKSLIFYFNAIFSPDSSGAAISHQQKQSTVINTIHLNEFFLKISEYFRNCSTFVKFVIMQLIQKNLPNHRAVLIKSQIPNLDEVLKRFGDVLESNDPVARAITLRLFGCLAFLFPHKINLHHLVRKSLDTNDEQEMEAAIYATRKLSQVSPTFAASILPKINSLAFGMETPLSIKLKLVIVLRNMHHNFETSSQAREICRKLMEAYPAQSFVQTTIDTLTSLTHHSLIDLDQHLEMLLPLARNDPRVQVQSFALKKIRSLLRVAMPEKFQNLDLLQILANTDSPVIQRETLLLIETIVLKSPKSIAQGFSKELINHLQILLINTTTDIEIPETCSTILAVYLTYSDFKSKDASFVAETTILGIISILSILIQKKQNISSHSRPVLVQSAVIIGKSYSQFLAHLVKNWSSLIQSGLQFFIQKQVDSSLTETSLAFICQGLSKLLVGEPKAKDFLPQNFDQFLYQMISDSSIFNNQKLFPWLSTCLISLNATSFLQFGSDKERVLTQPWNFYQVAKSAFNFGKYEISSQILTILLERVESEDSYLWLQSLTKICAGEVLLQKREFSNALVNFETALQIFKKSSHKTFQTQRAILLARIQMVELCSDLKFTLGSLPSTSLTELQKCPQLLESSRKFFVLSQQHFSDTRDNATRGLCLLLSQVLDLLAKEKQPSEFLEENSFFTLAAADPVVKRCKAVLNQIEKMSDDPQSSERLAASNWLCQVLDFLVFAECGILYPKRFLK